MLITFKIIQDVTLIVLKAYDDMGYVVDDNGYTGVWETLYLWRSSRCTPRIWINEIMRFLREVRKVAKETDPKDIQIQMATSQAILKLKQYLVQLEKGK